MRIARKILTLCDGKDRSVRITEAQCRDLILPHLQCLESRKERCPLLCFWEPISRSLNMFFNEEDWMQMFDEQTVTTGEEIAQAREAPIELGKDIARRW
jgi:hypothetical protein